MINSKMKRELTAVDANTSVEGIAWAALCLWNARANGERPCGVPRTGEPPPAPPQLADLPRMSEAPPRAAGRRLSGMASLRRMGGTPAWASRASP